VYLLALGGAGRRRHADQDNHDRCHISQGASQGFAPVGQKAPGRLIGRTKGSVNTTPHAVTDAIARSITFFMLAGRVNDDTNGAALLGELPDGDWFRDALKDKEIKRCIRGAKTRPIPTK